MSTPQPRYTKEEFAQRGDDIFERLIRPRLKAEDEGKFVVIDIETGAYEIDTDELAASDRLLASHPNAQTWLRRVGSRYVRHLAHLQRPGIRFDFSDCRDGIVLLTGETEYRIAHDYKFVDGD